MDTIGTLGSIAGNMDFTGGGSSRTTGWVDGKGNPEVSWDD